MPRRRKGARYLDWGNGRVQFTCDFDPPTAPEQEASLDQMFEDLSAAFDAAWQAHKHRMTEHV
jgi:5,10-methylenetetrahydrofolate reductase